MARIRTIKPDFFTDEDIAELDFIERIVFIGLWTQADRDGKLEDRPKKLKVVILPYDNKDMDKILNSLQEHKDVGGSDGFILRYKADGKKYIKINNFKKHQRVHHTEQDSVIPDPKSPTTGKKPSLHGCPPKIKGRKGKERKGKERSVEFSFEDIWKRYPNKDGKKEALKHFNATVKTKEEWNRINKSLDNYLVHLKANEWKNPKNGSTWFNNWQDWEKWKENSIEESTPTPCRECGSVTYRSLMSGICDTCKGKDIHV